MPKILYNTRQNCRLSLINLHELRNSFREKGVLDMIQLVNIINSYQNQFLFIEFIKKYPNQSNDAPFLQSTRNAFLLAACMEPQKTTLAFVPLQTIIRVAENLSTGVAQRILHFFDFLEFRSFSLSCSLLPRFFSFGCLLRPSFVLL